MSTLESADPDPSAKPARRRWTWQRIARVSLEILVVVALFVAIGFWQARDLLPGGEPAPPFSLVTLDGEILTAESLRGRTVVLHFWATWCGVCRREFGALNAVHRRLGDDAILLAIADDANEEALRRFVQEHRLEYPIAIARPETLEAFHVSVYPTTYYVAPDGRVITRDVGMTSRYGMRARIWWATRRAPR